VPGFFVCDAGIGVAAHRFGYRRNDARSTGRVAADGTSQPRRMALGAFREQSAKACASMEHPKRSVAANAMCCDRPAHRFASRHHKEKGARRRLQYAAACQAS